MPININQPDLRGLASVARGSDLSNLGGLGLSAIGQLQQAQQAQQQLALERMRLQDQSGLGLLANDRANRALDQQKYLTERAQDLQGRQLAQNERKMAMQGQQFQDNLGLKQQELAQQGALGQSELALKEKALQQQQTQKELARLLDQDKAELDKKGNFAAYVASAMENAKSPEEANMIRVEALKNAVKDGILSKKEANQYSKLPLSQFANQAKYQAMVLGKVSEMKAGLDKKVPSGTQIYDPATGKLVYSSTSEPTTGTTTATQKDIVETMDMVDQLDTITEKYADEYMTAKGNIKGWYGGMTSWLGADLPGSKEAQEFRTKQSNFNTDVSRIFSQYLHKMTGSQFGMQEFERRKKEMINADDDPVTFKAKAKSLKDYMKKSLELKKKLLREKIPVGSEEYEAAFQEKFTPKNDSYSFTDSAPSNIEQRIESYKKAGKTDEEIKEYGRKKGWIK